MNQPKTPFCQSCGRRIREHIGMCTECRDESTEYNPTPVEIATMCAEMRAHNMAEREKMFLEKAHEADYVPKTYRMSRFHKS